MKKLKAWMAEHKKFSVIALCLLLMFTCGSAMSAINVSHHRAETAKEQNVGNNTDTTTAAEKKTKEETGKVELTDAQKEIIKGYDSDTKELIDTLSSSVWSVSEGRYTLKFADDSYVETVNGTPTVHSYAISRIEKTSDGYGGYLYTIVFETDTGTHIVTYTDGSGAAVNSDSKTPGENTISTLTSSTMFAQKNTAYERAEAVANITVKGMNSEVTKLFGGDEKAVITALSKWCAVHYPSVTEATWQKELVAELGSLFLSADLGIQSTDLEGEFYENHVSYLQSWMNALENDPSYLFKAASKADHADTFIMERYEEELGKNIEIDAPELEEEVSLAGESHDMVSASEHQTESEMPEPALAAIL